MDETRKIAEQLWTSLRGQYGTEVFRVILYGSYEVGHAISREEAENLLPTVQQFVAEVRIYLEKEGETL